MKELIITDRENIVAIANAVRTNSNTTEEMTLNDIVGGINYIASNAVPTLQTKTITPTTSSQNITPDSGYDGLSKVTVNAIPSSYVKPTATKAATTYTPTTSNWTISAGTYCSGIQTIKGDSNLKPENIAEGVSIFGVTGNHSGGGGGDASDVSVSFSVELTEEMYEPGANLYTITANDPNFDIHNFATFKLTFHYSEYGSTQDYADYIATFAKCRTSDTIGLVLTLTAHGKDVALPITTSGQFYIPSNSLNTIQFIGTMDDRTLNAHSITGYGIAIQ